MIYEKEKKGRYGPAPTLNLGVDGASDRATYQRRHLQAAKLQKRLDAGDDASIRVRDRADADALVEFFKARHAVTVKTSGDGWRVTIVEAGEALIV